MWLAPAAIAALRLSGLPRSAAGWVRWADRAGILAAENRWPQNPDGTWRRRAGRGGGLEIKAAILPARVRARLAAMTPAEDDAPRPEAAGGTSWAEFELMTTERQEAARQRLAWIEAINRRIESGDTVVEAVAAVARESGQAEATLWRWRRRVAAADPADRLPLLADRRGGPRVGRGDGCSPEAWDMIRADYLRPERPTFASCYRRLARVAAERGWQIPERRTLERRLNATVSAAVQTMARGGADSARRLYPAQVRDKTGLSALQMVNADGHRWDVWVQWPDGEIGRPCMVAWQDVFSGYVLSHRIDRTEHRDSVRLSFGDLVDRYGIPDEAVFDNGRAFAAKWLTGGTPNRYRFRVRDEDPLGIMPALGVKVRWAEPYAGQSKPIERAFRDFCDDIARHPALAGAWVGNHIDAKPENYRSRAVPLAVFEAVVAEGIQLHNERAGRRSAVCAGRSLADVFRESYAATPIRRASDAQRRLFLLAAEGVRADRQNGVVRLPVGGENRYWAEFLLGHRGERLVIRFDPASLHDAVHVYRLDGAYLGRAACIASAGFADADAAQQHARARRQFLRATREALAAERKLSIDQVAALLPRAEPPEPPAEPVVVRPLFSRPAAPAEDDRLDAFAQAVSRLR